MIRTTRRALLGGTGALAMAAIGGRAARANEAVTYLFPAPSFLPAFIPHQVAQRRGYFAQEGVAVTFQTGRGGADVAKQVAVGNADLGGAVGDTSMIVRPNGLAVRGVALLGARPIYQVAARKDRSIASLADLRGKKVGVLAFQDTSYYALLGTLAGAGLRRQDLQIQAVGPAGMTQLMINGSLDAIMAVPDWSDVIESAGVPLDYFPIDRVFPAMAQAILASDEIIQKRPAAVRGLVRGVLRAMADTVADPVASTRDFIAAVPQHAGKEAEIERICRRYVDDVYGTPTREQIGRFDPERVRTVQRFYIDNGIVQTAVPVDELFTNQFAGL